MVFSKWSLNIVLGESFILCSRQRGKARLEMVWRSWWLQDRIRGVDPFCRCLVYSHMHERVDAAETGQAIHK